MPGLAVGNQILIVGTSASQLQQHVDDYADLDSGQMAITATSSRLAWLPMAIRSLRA